MVKVIDARENHFLDEDKIEIIYRIFLFAIAWTFALPSTLLGIGILSLSTTHDETYRQYLNFSSHGYGLIAEPESEPLDTQGLPEAGTSDPQDREEMKRLIQDDHLLAIRRVLREQGLPVTDARREAEILFAEGLGEFFAEMTQGESPESGPGLEVLVEVVRERVVNAYNTKVLWSLYFYLMRQVGEEITEEIFNNSANFNSEVVNNQRICTIAECVTIVERAQQYRRERLEVRVPSPEDPEGLRHEYDQIMTRVQAQVASGVLRASTQAVFGKFPRLRELMRLMDDLEVKRSFSQMIGLTFILQEIRNPKVLLFCKSEKTLFQAMGVDVRRIEEKKDDHLRHMRELISSDEFLTQLHDEGQQLDGVQALVESIAIEQRLVDGGGDGSLAPYLRILVHALRQREDQLQALLTKCLTSLELRLSVHQQLRDRPDVRAAILSASKVRIERAMRCELSAVARQLLEQHPLNETLLDAQASTPLLPTLESQKMFDLIRAWVRIEEGELKSELEWHEKWGIPIEKDLIQGIRDPSECLGSGICEAVSTRLMLLEQRNPKIGTKQLLGEVALLPVDRMRQALYKLAEHSSLRMDGGGGAAREERLRRLGISKQTEVFGVETTQKLRQTLDRSCFRRLCATNGVIGLFLCGGVTEGDRWGHACYLRIDEDKRVIRFFDPNLGMSKNFYQSDFVSNVTEMLECFCDHLNRSYKGLNMIFGYQNHLLQRSGGATSYARAPNPIDSVRLR